MKALLDIISKHGVEVLVNLLKEGLQDQPFAWSLSIVRLSV